MNRIFFRWTNSFKVGVESVDGQHERLVNLVNKLYTAFLENTHKEKIGGILEELADYTIYHFKEEEQLMEKMGVQSLQEHRKIHAGFIEKVDGLIKESKENSNAITYKTMTFLREWLSEHILKTDRDTFLST